ncbi:hypothetical protein, partial [Bacillus bingmayongensis]|uniref:hypothetical protein n=1 Tax=Bacillus bingmayongensis TaxID=1150157 RepID=UPI00055AE431
MKYIHSLILVFLLITSLLGCNNKTSNHNTSSTVTDFINEDNKNSSNKDQVGTELEVVPKQNEESKKRTFESKDGSFSASFHIASYFPETVNYRLILLLDYKKINFNLENDTEKRSYFDVSIGPNKKETYTIEFPKVTKGIHDVVAILIREPNQFLTSDHYVPSDHFYVFQRFQIKFENNNIINKPNYVQISQKNKTTLAEKGLFITNNETFNASDVLDIINKKDIQKDYWLHLYGRKNEEFIIIPMVGYDINPKLTNGMYFKSIYESDMSLKLNFKDIDLSKKQNQINILLIRNPYINLEDKDGKIVHPELQFLDGLNRFQMVLLRSFVKVKW